VNFEIRASETFWKSFRELLSVSAQESVLDLIEGMREHPGDYIDRGQRIPRGGIVSKPIFVETDAGTVRIALAFQYGDDELTLHIDDVFLLPQDS